ncbi:T9SS type A sorting domain-containing protein [Flavobacterium proteolyticum]|uniref:T9SS type A sorting domain-containing protein n=1 Tax=Flavobacterium proteolyticum TaxID=2911683 RepID=A0ABR9WQ04_9FLAO|nr:T9SS type A sorting domain-containing protein [Flavobacterium proteolyticum]MBE9575987.1 T9SS type A sorting domain-containing protein [Flavobacterium proteolyticum]
MKKLLHILSLFICFTINAQNPGDISQNFGYYSGFNNVVRAIEIQVDGKILIGGDYTNFKGITENGIIRLNPDGSKDTSFNIGSGFNATVCAIKKQSDGKILVAGNFTTYKGVTENRIIRLNEDGTKDTSFSIGTGFNNVIYSLALQTDGKIVIGGQFSMYNGITEKGIIRLNPDGTKDTTFSTGAGFDFTVFTIKLQTDGKIVAGGDFTTYKGVTENRIIRLNTDGTKDTTFATGTGCNNAVYTIEQQVDGKIILGGSFTGYKGVTQNRIIRLNADGTKDTAFNVGTGFDATVYTINIQADDKIVIGGSFNAYKGVTETKIIRLNTDGTKDATFNSGTGFNNYPWVIVQQADGKILIGGNFTTYKGIFENKFIRLNTDGTNDTTFNTGDGFNNIVNTTKQQADGKILVGGSFTTYKRTSTNRIIRLNTDGTKDDSFNIGTGFNNSIRAIEIQNDGKILVGGDFTSYNGVTENRIIRLNADGTKDTSFGIGAGFNDIVYTIKQLTSGKILVGGAFTSYKGITKNRIICLNSDGTEDTSFNTGTGFNIVVMTTNQQADNKIIIGGGFTSYNGISENRLIRLNTDGTKDGSFNIGTGFNNNVSAIEIQNDGKILVGGDFITYKGIAEVGIVKLNSDGTKDASFNTGTGFNNSVSAIEIQNDGKILVGGNFTTYKGVTENRTIRLNTDGSKDTTFNTGTGFNNAVNTIEQLADGKALVGGAFTTYKGNYESVYLVGLNSETTLSSDDFVQPKTLSVYPNPSNSIINIDSEIDIEQVIVFSLQGQVVLHSNKSTIDVSNLSNGIYLIQVKTTDGKINNQRIIKN